MLTLEKSSTFALMEKRYINYLLTLLFLVSFPIGTIASIVEFQKDSVLLEEVVVAPKTTGTMNFKTTAIQTQKITNFELSRAACCNLAESFETNPSVDVSYSDAVTGAKQIRLLGLDGEYVQLLTENFPNFRGLATPYGLDYIPGPWMESIYVSKGTSSVKNGYEAITGQINVEYKKPPLSDILTANLFIADNLRMEANADASFLLNDALSTGLFFHYSTEEREMDSNDDNFLDIPLKRHFNVMNRWYYRTEKFISQTGIHYLYDKRTGGQVDDALPAESSVSLYRNHLEVNRVSFFTKNGYIINPEKNESLALIFTGSFQKQESDYGPKIYNADESNLYANLIYEKELAREHKLSSGVSLNYDNIKETRYANSVQLPHETTSGAYLEYTYNKDYKLIILAGLRADYSSLYDFFITPRLHVKYNFTDWMHLRGTVGKGYRSPHILAENNYYFASSRAFRINDNIGQEEAWNYGLNLGFAIPVNKKELSLNGEWYYTDFKNQVVIDLDSNPHEVSFYNLDGKSYSSVFQVEASYPFFRGFTMTAAYRWMDVKTEYNGVLRKKPLISDYKALVTASYQTPLRKWQFDFTSQFNGGGRMPVPDADNPLWDDTFSSYTSMSAQVSKFFRNWSVYAGVENLLDYTQEDRIIAYDNPWGPDFDATMIWGPVHGRKFYLGFRYTIPRL